MIAPKIKLFEEQVPESQKPYYIDFHTQYEDNLADVYYPRTILKPKSNKGWLIEFDNFIAFVWSNSSKATPLKQYLSNIQVNKPMSALVLVPDDSSDRFSLGEDTSTLVAISFRKNLWSFIPQEERKTSMK